MSRLLKKTVVQIVKHILTVSTNSRDDDSFILVTIWNKECDALGIDTRKGFLNAYYKKKLTSAESIRRTRQKLQELYPELRGEKYEDRKDRLEPEVRKEITNFKSK
jgi:hypothetical protein